jgi:hypothetical protein
MRLKRLRKPRKTSIRIGGRQGQESNPGPPEYQVGVLATRPRRSVAKPFQITYLQPSHHSTRIDEVS